jgi:uracil-DNA glycosylase
MRLLVSQGKDRGRMTESKNAADDLAATLGEVRQCTLCREHLPLGPRPVLVADPAARLLIVGQAPGTRVHASGIPWDDPSGDRLRDWLGLTADEFYNARNIAIVPMGLCYPGRGKSGDLPPRPECAPRWHPPVLAQLPNIETTLLIGQYAQRYYLGVRQPHHRNLTERVKAWREFAPRWFPLVHPSPRNQYWLQKNPWFEQELIPALRPRVRRLLTR